MQDIILDEHIVRQTINLYGAPDGETGSRNYVILPTDACPFFAHPCVVLVRNLDDTAAKFIIEVSDAEDGTYSGADVVFVNDANNLYYFSTPVSIVGNGFKMFLIALTIDPDTLTNKRFVRISCSSATPMRPEKGLLVTLVTAAKHLDRNAEANVILS